MRRVPLRVRPLALALALAALLPGGSAQAQRTDSDVRPFFPTDPTVSIIVGASSAEVALTVPSGQGDQEIPSTVRVACPGTQTVFLEFGSSSAVTATTSETPMLANDIRVFLLPRGITNVAAIAAGAGTTCYFTSGHGS